MKQETLNENVVEREAVSHRQVRDVSSSQLDDVSNFHFTVRNVCFLTV
jgi:hypothetical protein